MNRRRFLHYFIAALGLPISLSFGEDKSASTAIQELVDNLVPITEEEAGLKFKSAPKDKGLAYLDNLKSLEKISLEGVKVNGEGIPAFLKAHPDCQLNK